MSDYLHPLLKRGVDASDSGPRIGERQRRHVGDRLGPVRPAYGSDFLARRPEQQLANSDYADAGYVRPAQAEGDQVEALMRAQARIPMYERPRGEYNESPGSELDHPLFQPRESPTPSDRPSPVQAAPGGPFGPSSFNESYWPGSESSAGSLPGAPRSLGLWQEGDPEPGEQPASISSSDTVDPALIGSLGQDSYRDVRRPISVGSDFDDEGNMRMPTRQRPYRQPNFRAAHYLDSPTMSAPQRARPPRRGFFQKLRSLFTGRGWR